VWQGLAHRALAHRGLVSDPTRFSSVGKAADQVLKAHRALAHRALAHRALAHRALANGACAFRCQHARPTLAMLQCRLVQVYLFYSYKSTNTTSRKELSVQILTPEELRAGVLVQKYKL